jgi:hypothetical protein
MSPSSRRLGNGTALAGGPVADPGPKSTMMVMTTRGPLRWGADVGVGLYRSAVLAGLTGVSPVRAPVWPVPVMPGSPQLAR